ncbi:heme-dependent oxidative N-demethylase family protein [Litorimonas sp. RW-G-Af-16]|uniref:heme-dependent oxidative N-demethylase family protein n=1 Tax=Litorimonas sp. RW-G-Af-16 TaxID=3241168 RepID=UPI00390C568F
MILNTHLPFQAWRDPQTARLPGMQRVEIADWLARSETFDAQMAYRRNLLREKRDAVFVAQVGADAACEELRDLIGVPKSDTHPLIDAALNIQEDLCILQKRGDDHILTAAVMCFPSSWDVRQKIGRSIASIHTPVAEFTPVASIVERMLSAIRVEQPLGRANFLIYTDPELHQPRGEGIAKPIDPTAPRYVRVERQTFRRLPETGAVVFAIHTYVIPARNLSAEAHAELALFKPDLLPKPD